MKILHVIHGMRVADGGPPRVAAGLGRGLAANGHDVTILATNGLEPDYEQLGLVGVDGLTCLPLPAKRTPADFLRETTPPFELVQFHGVWNPAATRLARRLRAAGVPYLVMPHGMLDRWSMAQKRLKKRLYLALFERKMLDGAARLHALNDPEYEAIADLGIKARHFVLPNGVDPEEFDHLPERGAYRRRLQHPDGPLVSYMARIHYKKGADLLVPAFCKLAPDYPDASLVVAGPDYGLQAELEEVVRRAGLEDRVLFPGMLVGEDRLALLNDTDVFALPSRQEGHPMSIVEAAYVGKPCLATEECHVPELQEAEAAEFVELTIDSVEAGLRRLLGDEAHRRALADRAQAYARAHWTWGSIAAALAREYEAILGA
jgi:glycosyltransferase involved in cell wall biosynthesis